MRVDLDAHAKLTCQIEEVLLLVAHHHGDVGNARLLELADLPLDEDLSANAEKTLGLLVGDGGEARGKARGHDNGVFNLVGLQRLEPVDGEHTVRNKSSVLRLMQDAIHRSKGETRGGAQLTLGHMSV